jgi:hypothetical protein
MSHNLVAQCDRSLLTCGFENGGSWRAIGSVPQFLPIPIVLTLLIGVSVIRLITFGYFYITFVITVQVIGSPSRFLSVIVISETGLQVSLL